VKRRAHLERHDPLGTLGPGEFRRPGHGRRIPGNHDLLGRVVVRGSDDAGVARWQRRLEPLHKRIAGGCHLTRRIDALIASAGFTLVDCEHWVEPGPRVFTAMVRGSARP
jgi:hypothetical protein